jgi:hypothetical protein
MATIIASGIGATLTGSPVIVGLISTSETANNLSFVVALLVSLFALGAGVGKVYKIWSKSIIASATRDELLNELVTRLADIEHRQIQIQEEVQRQAVIIEARSMRQESQGNRNEQRQIAREARDSEK